MRWLVVSFWLCACRAAPTAPQDAPARRPSAATRWVETRAAHEATLLEAPARVLPAPQSMASVSPPLTARVVRVRARAGQQVAVGDVLLDVLMPELLHAAGDLAGEQIKIQAFTQRHTQLEVLRNEGLVRLAELSEVEALLATARADAQAARATLRAAGVTDAQAAALLTGDGVMSLRAPIAGVVTAVDAIPGQVREPAGLPLAMIVGAGEGRVEARLSRLPGGEGSFSFVSASGAVPLELVSVAPRLEVGDGTRLAWFVADGGVLSPGATGRVRQLASPAWRVVPATAVTGEASARVRVRRGENAEWVHVQVIARGGAEAIVVGLSPSDQVASDAAGAP